MKPSRSRLLALAVALSACSDRPEVPTAPIPQMSVPPTSNSACTVHWASGVNGSWFDATKWNPAGVPGSTSSVCIDAAGTYTITMDPPVDTTPVDILALDVGGSGARPTLNMAGNAARLNISQGVFVRDSATLKIGNSVAGVITAGGTVTNLGTIAAGPVCGGCGAGDSLNADVINQGTLVGATPALTLGKVNGAYENTGTINLPGGSIIIPASAGNASFSFDAGEVVGTGNFGAISIQAGTVTLNGGKARERNTSVSNDKPRIIVDGADLIINPTATDTVVIGVIANPGSPNSITGDIPALTWLWVVPPYTNLQPGTINFIGNPTNAGTIKVMRTIDGGQPGVLSVDGAGRLTNNGTIYQGGIGSGATFLYPLEITNNGTINTDGTHMTFGKPGGLYENNGSINLTGFLNVVGSTLVNAPAATIGGNTIRVDGGRMLGTGTLTANVQTMNGGTLEPGYSPGMLAVRAFQPQPTGVYKVELGGTAPGTEYDQVDGVVSVGLQGTLDITEINGFQFVCGQVFDVVLHPTPGTAIGSFSTVNGLTPAPGRALRVVKTPATATAKGTVSLVAYDPGLKVCVGPNPLAISEGGPAMRYAITLGSAPTSSVTVTPTPNSQVTVSPASLTFTASNWQVPQFFTVTAVDDNVVEGNHTGSVTHAVTSTDASYNGYAVAQLTANITDNDTNSPPVTADDNATTAEDTAVDIDVLVNDSDPDSDPLTVSSVSAAAHGTVTIQGGGTHVRYTPASNYSGPDAFTYTVSDGRGMTANASVAVTVTAVPDAPVAANDQASTVSPNAVVVSVLTNDSDPDGDALSVVAVTQPANGTAQISGGGQTATYTPNAGYSGSDTFSYTVDDGTGRTASASVSISVLPANRPPVANDDARSVGSGTTSTLFVLVNDSDPDGDPLIVVSVTQPTVGSAAVASGSQGVTYTAPAGFAGQTDFTYTISDGQGGTATARVFVTVSNTNSPPIAGTDAVTVQSYSRSIRIPVLANDSDPDGDPLTIISVTTPTHGTTQISGRDIIYQPPTVPYYGGTTFWYTISDGRGGEAQASVGVRLPYDLQLTSLQATDFTPGGAGNWALFSVNGYVLHHTFQITPYDYIIELPPGTISAGEQLVWPQTTPDPVFTTSRCTVQNDPRTGQPQTMRCTIPFHPANWPTPINYVSGQFAVRLGGPSNRRVKVTMVPSVPDINSRNNTLTTTIRVP